MVEGAIASERWYRTRGASAIELGQRDLARRRNAGEEWAGMCAEDSNDARERRDEDRRDLHAAEVSGGQNKYAGTTCAQGCDLQGTISQALVLCQDYPAAFSYDLEPDAIFFVAGEVFVMHLYGQATVDEFRSGGLNSQGAIEEKYCSLRRLHSGSLLRPARFPRGNPSPGLPLSRRLCSARRWTRPGCRCPQ